jgi:hypothetical protein
MMYLEMENKGKARDKIIKTKTEIYDKVLNGIIDAIDNDSDIYFVSDIELYDSKLVLKLTRDTWIYSLDRARLFFEAVEDYAKCKRCRDLIKKLKEKE